MRAVDWLFRNPRTAWWARDELLRVEPLRRLLGASALAVLVAPAVA